MWYFNEAGPLDTIATPKLSEFFSSSHCEAVVREAIQNSLDATPNGSELKTKITFTFFSSKQDEFTQDYSEIQTHCDAINKPIPTSKVIKNLIIEDFNTTGLEGNIDKFAPDEELGSFYSFWWEEGTSKKKTGSGGSHGVGKSTLSSASKFNTFLALTKRKDSPQEALIGFCGLPPHKMNGKQFIGYARYGHLSETETGHKLLPYINQNQLGQKKIQSFKDHCDPIRNNEDGLSILIPWLHEDISFKKTISVILEHFFLPIVKENLTVEVVDRETGNSAILAKNSILEIVDGYITEPKKQEHLRLLISVALEASRISNNREFYYLATDTTITNGDFELKEKSFTDANLALMREDYKAGKVVPVLFDLPIMYAEGNVKRGYFCVYIKNSPDRKKLYRAFRGDIMIFREKCSSSHPYDVVLVDVFNDDEGNELSEYMKYSEDPGHSEWKWSPANKSDGLYKFGESWQKTFIQRAASSLLNVLTGTVEKEKLTDFAEDIFFIEKEVPDNTASNSTPKKSKRNKSGDTSPEIPDEIPPKGPDIFSIEKTANGFKIRGTNYFEEIFENTSSFEGRVKAAFIMPGTSKSKWFNSFIPADFSFSTTISIENSNAEIEITSDNEMAFKALSSNFEITLTGFDPNRDLHISVKETWGK